METTAHSSHHTVKEKDNKTKQNKYVHCIIIVKIAGMWHKEITACIQLSLTHKIGGRARERGNLISILYVYFRKL